jgi:hypothetical protein
MATIKIKKLLVIVLACYGSLYGMDSSGKPLTSDRDRFFDNGEFSRVDPEGSSVAKDQVLQRLTQEFIQKQPLKENGVSHCGTIDSNGTIPKDNMRIFNYDKFVYNREHTTDQIPADESFYAEKSTYKIKKNNEQKLKSDMCNISRCRTSISRFAE